MRRSRQLHETGEGHAIKGVRGTGYGWLNAVTHFASHEMRSKSKIESNMVGEASKLGRRAFTALTALTRALGSRFFTPPDVASRN